MSMYENRPAQSPDSVDLFGGAPSTSPRQSRNKRIVSFDENNDDLFSLYDVSIASSNRSEVRKVRDERRLVPDSTLIPISPFERKDSPTSQQSTRKEPTYLDDPNFAPPPTMPIVENRSMFNFNAEGGRFSELPSYEKIRHSGYIMTRFSQASLLTRKWRQNFWILYEDYLCFYRSKEDFDQWLMNPFLSKEKRDALVKRCLRFNKKSLKLYNLGNKRLKSYRRSGNMHHFKLNKHESFGGAISDKTVGAFASLNEVDVAELYTIIYTLLKPAQVNSFEDFFINYDGKSISSSGHGDYKKRPTSAGSTSIGFAALTL